MDPLTALAVLIVFAYVIQN